MFIYAFVRSAYLYLSYPMRILLHQRNMIIDTFYADDIQLSIPCLISLNDFLCAITMYFLLILCRDGVSSMPNLTEQRIHVFGFLDAVQRITKQQSFSMSECSKPLPPSFKLKQHVKLLFCNLYVLISFWRIRTDDRQSDVELLQHVSSIHVAYLCVPSCNAYVTRVARSAVLVSMSLQWLSALR